MIFNDVAKTNPTGGIIQECETILFGDEGYTSISGDTNRLYQFTSKANQALDRFAFLAMTSDGRWQWDDTNYTDVSIATTNIVATQRNYTFALEHLEIEKVLVASSNGTWSVIEPMDQEDWDEKYYLENNNSRTGTPNKYDKRGDTIFLDVTPNYSGTGYLKIYFKRGPSYFTIADTTKKPGIPSVFHSYIPLHASVNYAIDKSMPIAKDKFGQMTEMERTIKFFYSARNKDEKPSIKPAWQNNK